MFVSAATKLLSNDVKTTTSPLLLMENGPLQQPSTPVRAALSGAAFETNSVVPDAKSRRKTSLDRLLSSTTKDPSVLSNATKYPIGFKDGLVRPKFCALPVLLLF